MERPLNAGLVGEPSSRLRLQTPALVVDLERFERNLARMAEHARKRKIALRPHAKTHKCAEIARRQIAAGALGICTAKLGEAEQLANAGIGSILVTSPVVSDQGISRVTSLNEKIDDLMIVADNPDVAAKLDVAAQARGKKLKVLVDIDPGLGRTGIRPASAPDLVASVARSRALTFAGLQCYAGQVQHLESPNERREKSLAAMSELKALCKLLGEQGFRPGIVSGGGTGTFNIDPDAGVLTELQVGSYIFMDRQYNEVWEKPGERPPFETSLFVQTTVISANRERLATTDAGYKSFATDAGPPLIAMGAPKGSSYFFFGDEQGGVVLGEGEARLKPGDVVTCVVPHCDPTVNLYDVIHAVRDERLESIWSIEARGRSA
jgi:3-hydroxy-D-aspartate aldolase